MEGGTQRLSPPNSAGHYSLRLDCHVHRMLFLRLRELSNDAMQTRLGLGLPDVSEVGCCFGFTACERLCQLGDGESFVNMRLNQEPFRLEEHPVLPSAGVSQCLHHAS